MRDSMVFYRNFRDALAKLPPDIRLEAYEQIFAYAFDEEKPSEGIAGAVVQMVVPQIDKNNERYENGKKGGRPPKNQTETKPKPNQNQTETTSEPKCKSVRVKECKSVSVEECESGASEKPKKEPPKRFRPPTLEEVEEYCFERNNRVDAQRFIDYYTSNGWRVGKNPMKDWKAAVRNWEREKPPEKVVSVADQRRDVLKAIAGGLL